MAKKIKPETLKNSRLTEAEIEGLMKSHGEKRKEDYPSMWAWSNDIRDADILVKMPDGNIYNGMGRIMDDEAKFVEVSFWYYGLWAKIPYALDTVYEHSINLKYLKG